MKSKKEQHDYIIAITSNRANQLGFAALSLLNGEVILG